MADERNPMRIDLNRSIPEAHGSEEAKRAGSPSSAGASATKTSESTGDAAKLSSGPVSVQALKTRVHQLPEVRQERVAALAGRMQSGSYRVSAEQVAEAVLSQMTGHPVG
jgi:negative regulator of flagellin synthesis FlgM